MRIKILALVGALLFSAAQCAIYYDIKETKKKMDLSEQINRSVDAVWMASLRAAEELSIEVAEKEFDGSKGFLRGHAGELSFIGIYVEQLESDLTLVGTQARTSSVPLTNKGFDKEFARLIIEQIKNELEKK